MTLFRTLILVPFIASSLLLTACSDKKNAVGENQKTEEKSTQGNWQAKASELSTGQAADIQADLAQLDKITEDSNAEALKLRDEIQTAGTDQSKIKKILEQSNQIQEKVQQQLMGLTLKSAEVQNIRTQMIDSLMTSAQLFKQSTAADFNISAPSEEFKQLTQRSMAIQQKIGADLAALHTQYPAQ